MNGVESANGVQSDNSFRDRVRDRMMNGVMETADDKVPWLERMFSSPLFYGVVLILIAQLILRMSGGAGWGVFLGASLTVGGLFAAFSSPTLYSLTNSITKITTTSSGLPTTAGVLVHAAAATGVAALLML